MSSEEIISLLILTILVLVVPSWRKYYFFPEPKTTKPINNETRINFYDFLKGVAILSVVIIHVGYMFNPDEVSAGKMYFLEIINNMCRFAIPVFIVCSGILLKPWQEIKEKTGFYTKKFFRIFLPYILVITVLAIFYNVPLKAYLINLFTGGVSVPYYFVIALFQLYLIYPFLSKYRCNKFLLPVSVLASLAVVIATNNFSFTNIPIAIEFLPFFVYGIYMRDFYLGEGELKKENLKMWYSLILIYVAITLMLPAMYFNMNLFYGLAIFNILYYYKDTFLKHFYYKFLSNIGKYSLWIFLIHFQIERTVYENVSILTNSYYLKYVLIAVLTIFFSYGAALVLFRLYSKTLKKLNIEL